ncbi:MAG: hypothetical protein GC168_11085 [Candidatus Hydrogenedens sp.]|nr:hypothetical protein [Candidatus Hydrogenedens sp.]
MNLKKSFRRGVLITTFAATGLFPVAHAEVDTLPINAGTFEQQFHTPYTGAGAFPPADAAAIAITPEGVVQSRTWPWYPSLAEHVGGREAVRCVAAQGGEVAVAAENGLYLGDGESWALALPREGTVRWAPMDVRAVVYDTESRLWFACPQGVGYRVAPDEWKLFTGADGLPFNDFTCMAAGPGGVWFGTTNGAIRFHDGGFEFRQGRRWLLDNHVRAIAVDDAGDAWIATNGGVSRIGHTPMTLAKKAALFEADIERCHRRTSFGYVNPATLSTPGDKTTATPRYTDNDGFNTGLYLAAMSFAYAATGDDTYRTKARDAFRALAFLSEVTQGGPYGGPKGLIARNVVPTTEPDPGAVYDEEYDEQRNQRDKLWKIMKRRVPVDASGEWYWKADASSDELDGHFFGMAIYYDFVCDAEEKGAVREVVRRIIDHLVAHEYNLVDYDNSPTRWGHFAPDDLNRNPAWQAERGLNSYSILTYLSIAHHVLSDARYREAYLQLAFDEGYGMNGMTQPKEQTGPRAPGHQPDDNMAFMNYYHLIRYETDPQLLSMYQYAIRTHWQYERLERNAFTNFVYGACARGQERTDQWGTVDLSPPMECYTDALDTLKRYPLDLVDWPMSNAHRIDMIPFASEGDDPPTMGSDHRGYAFPIDERQEIYWDWNYWRLSYEGDGTTLRPPHHYLLAYYMGLFHGFISG